MSELVAGTERRFFRHRFPLGDGRYIEGKVNVESWVRSYRLPQDFFKGRRVLDIGAWSGGFSFYFERLGATVVALDVMSPEQSGFDEMKTMVGGNASLVRKTVYDLDPAEDGMFDVVFYQGVFYHLKHPILALEKINAVLPLGGVVFGGGTTSDTYFGHDGLSINPKEKALNDFPLAFFVRDNFLGDKSNWWIPNRACLAAWLKRCGFESDWITTKDGAKTNTGHTRSVTTFVARKISDPEPEFP